MNDCDFQCSMWALRRYYYVEHPMSKQSGITHIIIKKERCGALRSQSHTYVVPILAAKTADEQGL